jgi:hypothetical protein
MKDKKHKYLEDLFDEHIALTDEEIEIPLLIEKAQKKFDQHLSPQNDNAYKQSEAEDLFKFHNQIRKHEERKKEVGDELLEIENLIKEFLTSLKGGKISYEKKDDSDKSKNTYLFWLEGDKVKCNR